MSRRYWDGFYLTWKLRIDEHTSIPEGVIMVVLIVITAATQIFFDHAFSRAYYPPIPRLCKTHTFKAVIDHLPMSLSTKKLATRFAKERQSMRPDGKPDADGFDLFSRDRKSWLRT